MFYEGCVQRSFGSGGCKCVGCRQSLLRKGRFVRKAVKTFFKNENEVSLIQERVESGQYENLFSQMHALKGAAGGIGLTNLYQALYTLVEDLRVEKYDDVADKTEVVINEYMKIREIVKLYADESTENRG